MLRPVHGKRLVNERGHLRQQIAEGAHPQVDPGLGVRGRHQRGMLTQFPRDAAPGIPVGMDLPHLFDQIVIRVGIAEEVRTQHGQVNGVLTDAPTCRVKS